jgi:hypothetical protein
MSDIIFTSGAVWAKSELSMINDSLLAIGEAPFMEGTVVDTIPIGTDGETAKRIIRSTMIEVQSRGWYFNTDYDYVLTPDINGFITLPPNVLRTDFGNTSNANRFLTKNNGIYDVANQTFIIEGDVMCDMVWLVDYTNLPPEAYEYISLRSARKFQQKVIGALETDQFTMRDEQDALVNLQRRQLQTQDYNIQNSRVSTRTHNGYLVAGLYGNKGRRNF